MILLTQSTKSQEKPKNKPSCCLSFPCCEEVLIICLSPCLPSSSGVTSTGGDIPPAGLSRSPTSACWVPVSPDILHTQQAGLGARRLSQGLSQ